MFSWRAYTEIQS